MDTYQISVLQFFRSIENPVFDILFEAITFLGEAGIIVFVLSWLIWNEKKSLSFAFTFTSLISMTTNLFLKMIVRAPRPWTVIENFQGKRVHTATGYSFPSGHTQNAATFYIMCYHLTKSIWIKVATFVLVILIAVSRLYLGVHWPMDVITALLLGFLFAFYLFPFLLKIGENVNLRKKISFSASVFFILIAIISIFIPVFLKDNSFDLGGLHKFSALGSAVMLSLFLGDFHLKYSVDISLKKKILRFTIGLIVLAVVYGIPKILCKHFNIENYLVEIIRYFSLGFFAGFIYPLVGKQCKLF